MSTAPVLRVPLRLPPDWTVKYNEFYEVDIEALTGEVEYRRYLAEDLLRMERQSAVPQRLDLSIDLGWYPDSDPHGAYRLHLFEGESGEKLATFRDRRWRMIQNIVDIWLDLGEQAKDIRSLLRMLTPWSPP